MMLVLIRVRLIILVIFMIVMILMMLYVLTMLFMIFLFRLESFRSMVLCFIFMFCCIIVPLFLSGFFSFRSMMICFVLMVLVVKLLLHFRALNLCALKKRLGSVMVCFGSMMLGIFVTTFLLG